MKSTGSGRYNMRILASVLSCTLMIMCTHIIIRISHDVKQYHTTNSERSGRDTKASAPNIANIQSIMISSRPSSHPDTTSQVTFLMILGLEGTGHHFYASMYEDSPAFYDHRLTLNENYTMYLQLKEKLYNRFDQDQGLWSRPCFTGFENSTFSTQNDTLPFDEVVRLLKEVKSKWEARSKKATTFPLMTGAGKGIGELSYPNFRGPCRPLQYPDVDIMYAACKAAEVTCKHIVMTRDPYEVIKSTTVNRKFSEANIQIKLLTTMLDVMNSQVQSHPEGLIAHWHYGNTQANPVLGRILGYANDTSFSEVYSKKFRATTPISKEDKKKLIPDHMQPYMDVFERSSDRLMTICDSILKSKERDFSSEVKKDRDIERLRVK